MTTLDQIVANRFEGTFTYSDFKNTMQDYAANGKSSGEDQSESMAHYTKLNWSRLKRLDKTTVLNDAMKAALDSISSPVTFLVITETWCGDAVQTLPFVQKMVEHNPNISLKLMWRDEEPHLIQEFLTNGGKSIPKVIGIDAEGNYMFNWGPRPVPAQEMVLNWRDQQEPKPAYREFSETLQRWYLEDKGATFQKEFVEVLQPVLT